MQRPTALMPRPTAAGVLLSQMAMVDQLNIWALLLAGAALVLGLFGRAAAIVGMVLIGLYFLSHPPLMDVHYGAAEEGNYLFVNKNLIEFLALWVLVLFPSSHIVGLDRFGESAPAGQLFEHFGFTPEKISALARELLVA